MQRKFTTSKWLFPPQTQELSLDEKWAFVYKKEQLCDSRCRSECGDNWDHVAFDPEHRLVLSVVNGKRSKEHIRLVLNNVKRIMGGRVPRLITSDEFSGYHSEILYAYGLMEDVPRRHKRGRPPSPRRVAPPNLLYATVHKIRRNGSVVKVEPRLQFGTVEQLEAALNTSKVSSHVNTAFRERQNGTDRHQNSRKIRKTFGFSKDWDIHNAVTKFTMYSYNFCWVVRTLRIKTAEGGYMPRTPAMAAGLAEHIWTMKEWALHPVV
jgi:IS1 family transposase